MSNQRSTASAWLLAVTLRATLIGAMPACATVNSETVIDDVQLQPFEKTWGPQEPRKFSAKCTSRPDLVYDCLVEVESSCGSDTIHGLARTTRVHRTISAREQRLEYGIAAALLLIGGVVIADAPNVAASDDPVKTNPVGRSGANAIGVAFAVAGSALLAIGIVDSIRALDTVESISNVEGTRVPARTFNCDKRVTTAIVRGSVGTSVFPVGIAGPDGRVTVDVKAVVPRAAIYGVVRPAMQLWVGEAQAGEISLDIFQKQVCESRLEELGRSTSDDDKLKFLKDCPNAAKLLGASDALKRFTAEAAKAQKLQDARQRGEEAKSAKLEEAKQRVEATKAAAAQKLVDAKERAETAKAARAKARDDAKQRSENQKEGAVVRGAIIELWERTLLSRGVNATVTAGGPANTTVVFYLPGATKVFVFKLFDEGGMTDVCRNAGFKRLIIRPWEAKYGSEGRGGFWNMKL